MDHTASFPGATSRGCRMALLRRAAICLVLILSACALPAGGFARAIAAAPPGFIYGSTQEPDTLNPVLTMTAAGQALDSAIFDSLLQQDARNVLRPRLATAWEHSGDYRTWTFHLRHGVMFADGVALTSTDVYYTYLLLVNPRIKVASAQGWDLIDRMRTPDRFTVVIHVRRVSAPWLSEVATTPILPKHALYQTKDFANDPFNRAPFGTGPYRVSTWVPGDRITLIANPRCWQGAPHLGTITYKLFPDDAHLFAALRAGLASMGLIDPQQAAGAARIPRVRLVETPSLTWYHVDLKQWGFLREQAVRQALDFATPKGAIVREILGGHGQIATGDIPPFLPGYAPPAQVHRYDPLRAAEILAANGFRLGPGGILQRCARGAACTPLQIALWSVAGDEAARRVNSRLAREWRGIGVGVSVGSEPAPQLFGPTGPQFTHEPTGITYGWTDGSDPDDRFYWNSAFVPASPSAVGGNDIAYFYRFSFQSEIDTLTDAGAAQTDPAKRRVVYTRIQGLLADQVPTIFLYWPTTIMATPVALRGFAPNPYAQVFWNVASWQ